MCYSHITIYDKFVPCFTLIFITHFLVFSICNSVFESFYRTFIWRFVFYLPIFVYNNKSIIFHLQIERRRKTYFPVQPKPPQGFKDYLMNRCTYVLADNSANRQIPSSPMPANLQPTLKDMFTDQEKARHRLRLQVTYILIKNVFKFDKNKLFITI